jgi:cbb3-type cytochrome oxidase maturation protein
MESIYLLIPVSVLLVFGIAIAFWWSVRSGQFDDLEGPGFRILMDDDQLPETEKSSRKSKKPKKFDLRQRQTRSLAWQYDLFQARRELCTKFSVGVGVR